MPITSFTTYTYRAFGMRIESEYALPELLAVDNNDRGGAALTISNQPLEPLWNELPRINACWAVRDDLAMLRVPDTAIFAMQGGDTVLVSPLPGANVDKLRLYLLGTCMGVILMQRRTLPLHGSALALGGKAYAVLGVSGAGKSTLASRLLEQGFGLLSDDLIAVTLGEDGIPMAMPAYPQQKIWRESLQMLGQSEDGLKPLFDRETKFAVPAEGRFCNSPLPLAGIFELVAAEAEPSLRPIERLEKCHVLLQHTFRNFVLRELGLMEWHFGMLTRFVGGLPMYRLHRPRAGNSLPELTALVLRTIEKEKE